MNNSGNSDCRDFIEVYAKSQHLTKSIRAVALMNSLWPKTEFRSVTPYLILRAVNTVKYIVSTEIDNQQKEDDLISSVLLMGVIGINPDLASSVVMIAGAESASSIYRANKALSNADYNGINKDPLALNLILATTVSVLIDSSIGKMSESSLDFIECRILPLISQIASNDDFSKMTKLVISNQIATAKIFLTYRLR